MKNEVLIGLAWVGQLLMRGRYIRRVEDAPHFGISERRRYRVSSGD